MDFLEFHEENDGGDRFESSIVHHFPRAKRGFWRARGGSGAVRRAKGESHRWRRAALTVSFLLVLGAAWRLAHAERFPADANRIDLVARGLTAEGDPSNSAMNAVINTAVLRAALDDCLGRGHVMYAADGTYLFDGPLPWALSSGPHMGKWSSNCQLEGQSEAGVVFRLTDNNPSFQNSTTPLAFVATGSTGLGLPAASGGGCGDEGFRNGIYDLTIDIGAGNPGARGVQWCGSNRASMRNVTVRTSDPDRRGSTGVYVQVHSGPSLIQNVTVEGFDFCARGGGVQSSATFSRIRCVQPRLFGVEAGVNPFFVEDLEVEGPVTGFRALSPGAHFSLIHAAFTGGDPNKPGVQLGDATYLPKGLLRDVTCTGCSAALRVQTTTIPGLSVVEHATHAPWQPFPGTPAQTLRLPEDYAPAPYYVDPTVDPNAWANARSYGADPTNGNDDSAGIQAALNSGRPIVYHPRSTTSPPSAFSEYHLQQPVTVPPTVRRWYLGEQYLRSAFTSATPAALIRIEGGDASTPPLTIERAWPTSTGLGQAVWIEHASPRTLYIRDVGFGGAQDYALIVREGAGPVFADNFGGGFQLEPGTSFSGRQYNHENERTSINRGGTVRILGGKSERDFILIATSEGGRKEVLGWDSHPGINTPSGLPEGPAFTAVNSEMSLSFRGFATGQDWYPVPVRETRCQETREVTSQQLLDVGLQIPMQPGTLQVVPLYVATSDTPIGCGALFVVGAPAALTAIETQMVERLESTGYVVTVADDTAVTSADADGKQVVLLSGSVGVSAVGAKFRESAAGVVVCKPFLFDAPYMAMGPRGIVSSKTQLSVVSSHPLAAGLAAGAVAVYPSPARLFWGRAPASGSNVALAEGLTNHYGVFGYEAGAAMDGGVIAAGRRVGCWIDELAPGLTPAGWSLFDAAIEWATQP